MPKFTDFKLSSELLRAITEMGYAAPTPIQAETLPILLSESTDLIGLAATGTGKTAAFALPMLERIDLNCPEIQSLILCPTRELALQVSEQVRLLGQHKGVRVLAIYGGARYEEQIAGLKSNPHVVVGTPGRLVDHLTEGKRLRLQGVKTLVLDEADEMISMGFKEELEKILNEVNHPTRNIWLFSATMSPGVRKMADAYLREPRQVQVNRSEMLSGTVEQIYYVTQEGNKPEVLCKLIDAADDFHGLVFFQTKALVMDAHAYLREKGYRSECLQGDMDQSARERAIRAFRDRKVNLLLCTDVAARGLDVKDVTHVINYSIPREMESYIHRIGRTARSGKPGLALSIITPANRGQIRRIEAVTKSTLKEGVIPSRKDIAGKKIKRLLPRFQSESAYERALAVMGADWSEALAPLNKEEIAARFLALLEPETFSASGTLPEWTPRLFNSEHVLRTETRENPVRERTRGREWKKGPKLKGQVKGSAKNSPKMLEEAKALLAEARRRTQH